MATRLGRFLKEDDSVVNPPEPLELVIDAGKYKKCTELPFDITVDDSLILKKGSKYSCRLEVTDSFTIVLNIEGKEYNINLYSSMEEALNDGWIFTEINSESNDFTATTKMTIGAWRFNLRISAYSRQSVDIMVIFADNTIFNFRLKEPTIQWIINLGEYLKKNTQVKPDASSW